MEQTALMLLLCLCSSALSDEVRLAAGRSRCGGRLEKEDLGDWEPVNYWDWNWNVTSAAVACRQLHCGSVVSIQRDQSFNVQIVCSDSVRLVQGTNRCSGRLEVKTNQSWSSVCEKDFDLQDAEVVCREIGCGSPSVLQGALYGEAEAPVGSREFLCEGSESALLTCSSRKSSVRNSCSPGQAVGLTCSGPDNIRLVGETSRCAGRLEMKHQEDWRPVEVWGGYWDKSSAAVVCAELDCGSAVSVRKTKEASERPVWSIFTDCLQSGSALRNCLPDNGTSDESHELICSDSVRLVQGTNRCSGRLEVKTNQSWSSASEKDFDLQDAEVVCREIGCGSPSVLQGALYGEAEAPVGSREFLCEGSESALLTCSSRKSSVRNSCSPGQAVGLTCSGPDNIRLVGETSRCAGRLEMKHQEDWRPVAVWGGYWDMNSAAVVCAELDCGSAVSARYSEEASKRPVWEIKSDCLKSGSALRNCLPDDETSDESHELICSDSVRLVQGTNRCSGRLEVKTNQSWSSVCEKDFDLQDAEVVCREIGCGSPSVLQGALYGEAEAPVGSREFLCEGSESALLTCSSRKSSVRNSCSPGQAVGLTCSGRRGSIIRNNRNWSYRCVYHVYVFSHNFSSMSQPLNLTVSASLTALIIRLVVVLLGLLGSVLVLYFKARRNQKSGPENSHHDEGSRAEGSLEEETAV
ncbi:scavenger receptor cysteine-rich type 1 protein M130-like [Poecilia latipinna]|uniref:scavenger receptor cysteine-rich type 1 protein M130-like n=1 Tax=Poecilia latipinna TaxID=48699 RepID=UPI00072E6F7F|nr:PREDICTED: scavenger receptor cysteine-rich type 1 protein M130-like [Poecilia latipinna]